MSMLDAATLAALQTTFLEESFEGLDRAETGLLALTSELDPEVIGDLFRAIHSIKGGAGAFGIDEITELAHTMENLLDDIRSGTAITADGTSALLEGVDELRQALVARQQGRRAATTAHAAVCARLVAARAAARAQVAVAPVAAAPVTAPAESAAPWLITFAPHADLMKTGNDPLRLLRQLATLGSTLLHTHLDRLPPLAELDAADIHLAWTLTVPGDVPRAELDDVFAWVEGDCDLSIVRDEPAPVVAATPVAPTAAPTLAPAPASDSGPPASSGVATLRVGIDKIDQLMNMVGELVITQSMLGELDDGPVSPERLARLREGLGLLARNTRSLQESVVRLRSMPVGVVFARLPRLVHDLGQRLGKDIAIEITGQSTELDKTVLEKLGDPLVHIVRNSIDHGIETAEDRERAGKSRQGTIRVHAEHRGSAIAIEIADDGRGLDHARILAVARERGLVAPDAQLRDEEIAQLIFAPGFSTAKEVSEISGRGVGMDVVWRHIKELRGEVHVESIAGKGTRTTLSLPLTLAIIDGQLLQVCDETYVIPLLSIVETVEIEPGQRHRYGDAEVVQIRNQIVPVIDLGATLGLRPPGTSVSKLLMVVETEGAPLGLLVDELLAQQQVVIKSLETNFGRVDGLAGATIMGDGRVAFILDIVALSRHVRRSSRTADPSIQRDQAA